MALWVLGGSPALLPLPGLGTLAVSPPTILAALTSTVDGLGETSAQLVMPTDNALLGLRAYVQVFTATVTPPFPVVSTNPRRVGARELTGLSRRAPR